MRIRYENALVSTEQRDLIESYLLGLHLYHTRRYLPVPGHGSIPKSRLLTRNWQLRLSWHSSSIFCSRGWAQETKKQNHFSVPTKGNVKQRQTARKARPSLPPEPALAGGRWWFSVGTTGLSGPCTVLRSRFYPLAWVQKEGLALGWSQRFWNICLPLNHNGRQYNPRKSSFEDMDPPWQLKVKTQTLPPPIWFRFLWRYTVSGQLFSQLYKSWYKYI